MGILKTRYERATDPTFRANEFIPGGRLVKMAAEGATPSKPSIVMTTAATDYSPGATATDVIAGEDVAVTHRGWMLLRASEAITVDTDVYPAAAGMIQMFTGAAGDAAPAGARPFGRSLNAATGVDAANSWVWVKPYL